MKRKTITLDRNKFEHLESFLVTTLSCVTTVLLVSNMVLEPYKYIFNESFMMLIILIIATLAIYFSMVYGIFYLIGKYLKTEEVKR